MIFFLAFFLPCNTKEDVYQNVHAALFSTIKMNGDQELLSFFFFFVEMNIFLYMFYETPVIQVRVPR